MQKNFTKKEIIAWTYRRDGTTIHRSAALSENEQLLTLLSIDGASIQAGDAEDTTPLHYACAVGSLETVSLLIEKGANVNAANYHDETPLLWSLIEPDAEHRFEKIKLLIKAGADINFANVDGETILHQAFRDHELTTFLLEQGAQVNITNRYEWTPLHYAVLFEECAPTIEKLIAHEAPINAQDDELLTPLHLAAKHQNLKAIELLKKAGANLQTKNNEGLTPYAYALHHDASQEILDSLKED